MAEKPRVRVPARTNDGFQNVAARLGIGTDNVSSGATYALNPITRQRSQLEWMYRGSWLVGQAVDCVAEDMVRAGIDISSSIEPDDLGKLQKGIDRRGIWSTIEDCIKWGRLYGGAIAVHLVEGQDLSTPLRMETVGKGQYKGLITLDRWNVTPSFNELVQEFGPDIGQPAYYDVMVSAQALRGQRVHHSRVIRYDGVSLPYWQRVAEYGWGLSIVERLYDRLVAFDSTTQGAAQLVYKAHLRTVKVKGLREILAQGGPAEEALIKMFSMIRQMQSNEGLTLLDGDDEFEAHSYTFAGMSDVLLQFAQQLSGALQIPLVRLFGQSPSGLNATGESDIRTYYDLIGQQQESRLRRGIGSVIEMVHRSDISPDVPKDLDFTFNSLWQMSETERATIAVGVTGAVTQAFEAGIVDLPTAMRELRQSADVTGVWSNIAAVDIDAAANEPPAPGELDAPELAPIVPDDDEGRSDELEPKEALVEV
ncbi:DUF1073 domain-containing protein [Mesorhizobium sp. BR1-1-16]|uniref:DUF1073 domain-containing protein n=1 Tax=Mesorhizobium sp. BR1-1-16 TaxID=2876653 RepID=UPI001CCD8A3E|nr:DUF1073 domain-containing protein [Mesorhizobium sp. BR1-1-16]MBZ9939150.1 DUF1073 domain-containing protein [Mesorhizobium sp. BR1-1-16]